MKRFIRGSRFTSYQGIPIRIEEGETRSDAIARFKAQQAEEASLREAASREEKEASLRAKAERQKTPRYHDGDIVLTKDGEYFQLYDGYYHEPYDDVVYDGVFCNPDGSWSDKWMTFGDFSTEVCQKDIKRKIKEGKKV